jgi:hypothetical protein
VFVIRESDYQVYVVGSTTTLKTEIIEYGIRNSYINVLPHNTEMLSSMDNCGHLISVSDFGLSRLLKNLDYYSSAEGKHPEHEERPQYG